MKKQHYLITLILSLICLFFPLNTNVVKANFTMDEIGKFDIRTENPKDLDIDKLKGILKGTYLEGHESSLLDASEKNGTNISFMIGQLHMENNLTQSNASNNNNIRNFNVGNVTGDLGYGVYNGRFSIFPSMSKGIQAYTEYVRTYVYGPAPKTSTNNKETLPTISEFLSVYAPTSDNNDHNLYYSVLGEWFEKFNQEIDGKFSTPSDGNNGEEEKTYSDGSKMNQYYDIFKTNQYIKGKQSLGDMNQSILSPQQMSILKAKIELLYPKLFILRWGISGLLFGYLMVVPLLYLLLENFKISPETFKKITGYDIYEQDPKKIRKSMLIRTTVLSIIVAITLSDLYVVPIQLVLKGITFFTEII